MRAKPHKLAMSDAMPHGQTWVYHDNLPIDYMVQDEFFQSMTSMIRAGDTIRLCETDGEHVLAVAEILAVRVKPAIEVMVLMEPRHTSEKFISQSESEPEKESFVQSDCSVIHKGRGTYAVVDPEGKEVCAGLEKETAERIANGTDPIPKAA